MLGRHYANGFCSCSDVNERQGIPGYIEYKTHLLKNLHCSKKLITEIRAHREPCPGFLLSCSLGWYGEIFTLPTYCRLQWRHGFSSLAAIQMTSRLNELWNLEVEAKDYIDQSPKWFACHPDQSRWTFYLFREIHMKRKRVTSRDVELTRARQSWQVHSGTEKLNYCKFVISPFWLKFKCLCSTAEITKLMVWLY